MKTWFTVFIATFSLPMMVGSGAFAWASNPDGPRGGSAVQESDLITGPKKVAEVSKPSNKRITRTNSDGALTIDVTWLKPDDVSAAEKLTFEVRMNTHSVDLEQYDMARLSRLETNGGPSIEALGWFNPGGGGHHRYGLLKFSATGPDGSPLILPETHFIEVVIQGVGGVPERRFRWDLLLTKTEKGRKSKWAQGILSRRSP